MTSRARLVVALGAALVLGACGSAPPSAAASAASMDARLLSQRLAEDVMLGHATRSAFLRSDELLLPGGAPDPARAADALDVLSVYSAAAERVAGRMAGRAWPGASELSDAAREARARGDALRAHLGTPAGGAAWHATLEERLAAAYEAIAVQGSALLSVYTSARHVVYDLDALGPCAFERVRALALAAALLERFDGPAAAEPAELRMLLAVARDFEAPVASVRALVGAGGALGENDAAEVRSALGAVEVHCGR